MDNTEFNPNKDYVDTIKNMGGIFALFNEEYFNNELVMPVITVRQDLRGRAYGWFVPHKVWTAGEGYEGSVEINMCSQWLDRPLEEIAGTMLHEMCHLYAYVTNKKDTSRFGYYHNKVYKEIAEKHGLKVTNTGSYYGWCETELTDESKLILAKFMQKGKILHDLRTKHSPKWFSSAESKDIQRKHSSTRKYVCPICKNSVRATKDINLICGDCNVKMYKLVTSERNL